MTFGDIVTTLAGLAFVVLFWVGIVRFGYLDNVLWTAGGLVALALAVRWLTRPVDPGLCECGHWLQPTNSGWVCVMGCEYETRRQQERNT